MIPEVALDSQLTKPKRKYTYVKRGRGWITCAVCGARIEKKGPNQRVCQHKCSPRPDFKQACVRCGEEKGYDDFYDTRDSLGDTKKFHTACKQCISTRNWEREKEKKCRKQ